MNTKKFTAALLAFAVGVSASAPIVKGSDLSSRLTAAASYYDYTEGTYEEFTYRKYSDHVEITDCDETAESVSIPNNIDGVYVTKIGGLVFSDCTMLRDVFIPATVTDISSQLFDNCYELKKISVSGSSETFASVDGVLYSKDMTKLCFYPMGKTDAEYIIPDTVTEIGDFAFFKCSALTAVEIPESVERIGYEAFDFCTQLASMTIPAKVSEIGDYAFYGCAALSAINVAEENQYFTSTDGVLFDKEMTVLITYPEEKAGEEYIVPDTVSEVYRHAFARARNVVNVTLPENVAKIGYLAFRNYYKLASVTVENPDCEFYDNSETVEAGITIRGYEGSTAQKYADTYGNAFEALAEEYTEVNYEPLTYHIYSNRAVVADCDEAAAEVEIPAEVDGVPVTAIGNLAFYNCTALTRVVIPDTVTSIGYMSFQGCEGLEAIDIPESVTFIDKNAFDGCTALKSITIPASVTEMGVYVFSNCNSLEAIYVDDENTAYADQDGVLFDKKMEMLIRYPRAKADTSYSVPEGVLYLDNGCFTGCENLTEVIMPDTLEQLIYNTFTGCDNIKEFVVPEGVWVIGMSAFNCHGMQSITILNPDCIIEDSTLTIANSFRGEYSYTGTIYGYTDSTAQAYAEKYGYTFVALDESTTSSETVYGDADCDGGVSISDVVLVMSYSGNKAAYPISAEGLNNADVYQRGDGVGASDALSIQKKLAQILTGLPESVM